VKSYPY